MNKLSIFTSVLDWQNFRPTLASSFSFGFVPTMGALHKGHLSLVERSLQENDKTLVSIFVNPTQFNDKNDFKNYPILIEQDIEQLKSIGCDFLLQPQFEDIYPDNFNFEVREKSLSSSLCGKSRPGHFEGMLTVVLKLLNIAQANRAYFGEKDYQQYLLIKNMAEAFFVPTQIISHQTIREPDGLALSSRNLRLGYEARKLAPFFYKVLSEAPNCQSAIENLLSRGFEIDYVEEKFGRRFGAVILNGVRLIDNVQL